MAEMKFPPAYKTLAFWLTVAMTTIGLAGASGLIQVLPRQWQLAVSWITVLLTALGYGAARNSAGQAAAISASTDTSSD